VNTIFMCVNYPIYNPAIGISKKIKTQIEVFQKLGFSVTYSAYVENGIVIYRDNEIVARYEYPKLVPKKLYGIIRRFALMKFCAKYLRNNNFTLGFIRWDAMDTYFFEVVKLMRKQCKRVLMDCHGYFPGFSPSSIKGRYTAITTKKNGYKAKAFIDLVLKESKGDNFYGIKAITIDTGINVDKYKRHTYVGNTNEIHMISVANETLYHGYDRIINGLSNLNKGQNNAKVFLHLVGNMSEKTKKMVQELQLNDCVYFHGYQTGESLERIYNSCNIGIGPLAPHRIGGKEGTGIKTKEYFAVGLPYFYAGQELIVPDDYPYVLKLEVNEEPIEIQDVIAFYGTIKDDVGMQECMRNFARENYSWINIFVKALETVGISYGK
jgi:glycosyltransferase involved in cell wall biosynthesis